MFALKLHVFTKHLAKLTTLYTNIVTVDKV